jgi:hypothetical protein
MHSVWPSLFNGLSARDRQTLPMSILKLWNQQRRCKNSVGATGLKVLQGDLDLDD